MILINIAIIITLFVAIAWTYHNLYNLERNKKIFVSIILIIVTFVITLIIYNVSKKGLDYTNINEQMIKNMKNTILALFTALNGLILCPLIASVINRLKIDKKPKGLIPLILVLILMIFLIEPGYIKSTQISIINSIHNLQNQ